MKVTRLPRVEPTRTRKARPTNNGTHYLVVCAGQEYGEWGIAAARDRACQLAGMYAKVASVYEGLTIANGTFVGRAKKHEHRTCFRFA